MCLARLFQPKSCANQYQHTTPPLVAFLTNNHRLWHVRVSSRLGVLKQFVGSCEFAHRFCCVQCGTTLSKKIASSLFLLAAKRRMVLFDKIIASHQEFDFALGTRAFSLGIENCLGLR